jgi:hypothetical protein
MRRLLLTISSIAAVLALLAGAGVASADPAPGPPVPVNPRVLHLPDLEIAPYVFQPSAYEASVVIRNIGSGPATASVLKWHLSDKIVANCWCIGGGDVAVAPLLPGAFTTVDMCAVFKAETSWLDDGYTYTEIEFEIAQIAGSEFFLGNNYRTLHIDCKA